MPDIPHVMGCLEDGSTTEELLAEAASAAKDADVAVVFAGLTAYDTQKLKALHESGFNHGGIAVLGALSLYLDFINMFLYLLRLLGRKK